MKTIAITKHEGVVALLVKKGFLSDDPEVRKGQVYDGWSTLTAADCAKAHVVYDTLTATLPYWVAADAARVTELIFNIPEEQQNKAPSITEKRATEWLARMDSYDVRRL